MTTDDCLRAALDTARADASVLADALRTALAQLEEARAERDIQWALKESARLCCDEAEARLEEAKAALGRIADGVVDVSGSAIIIGYPQDKEALAAVRAFLHQGGSDAR